MVRSGVVRGASAALLAWVSWSVPVCVYSQDAEPIDDASADDGSNEASSSDEEAALAQAQLAYERGITAARGGRWPDALQDFERAYELHPDANLRVNVATAQAHVGRLVEALTGYRLALSEMGDDDPQLRRVTEAGIRELEPRVPEVSLELSGLRASDSVYLDGQVVEDVTRSLPADPGSHEVRVERDQQVFARLGFDLAEGERRVVTLRVEEPESEVLADAIAEPTNGGDAFYESPWFWATAGGLVAIAVAVLAVVLATSDGQGGADPMTPSMPFEPFSGNLNPGTLRLP